MTMSCLSRQKNEGYKFSVGSRKDTKPPTASPIFKDAKHIFLKTKKCKFHAMGMCSKGSLCKFAHSLEETRPLPDLSQTQLCPTLTTGGTCGVECKYAHTLDDLCKTRNPQLLQAQRQKQQQDLEQQEERHEQEQKLREQHGQQAKVILLSESLGMLCAPQMTKEIPSNLASFDATPTHCLD